MLDHRGEILILTGPPGSGKTTTAATLAPRSGSPKVHLHADDFWKFIKHGAIPPQLPEAHEQNRVVLNILAKVAADYAEAGYFVILDGIVGPWFLAPFLKLPAPVHYIVLRPALAEAIERCVKRGGDTLADPVAVTRLHQQFSSLGALERYAVRTEFDTQEQVLRKVIEALTSEAHRLTAR
jgi:adenylate kinase family enzyme